MYIQVTWKTLSENRIEDVDGDGEAKVNEINFETGSELIRNLLVCSSSSKYLLLRLKNIAVE